MFIDPKISGLSIVLVGSFNPRIFNADWFVRNEILTDEQIKGAKVEIIHQQITQIEFDFFSLTVQPEKFHASTTRSSGCATSS